jgi:aminoglycoside phosphotransferase (APT) family kinase protein
MEESRDALGGSFLIAERLPGSSPVPSMDYFTPPPKSDALACSLAKQVAILHGVPIGDLDAVLTSSLDAASNPTWATDTAAMEQAWNANVHAPSMAVTAAFAWMRAHADLIEDRRGFVHSDLLLHNILAEGEEVSAVLDWEAAHIGHPAEDLGYLRPVVERMTDWNRFLDAYAAAGGRCPSPTEIDFFTLRALTRLSTWVQYARAAFETGRTADFNMAEVGAAFLPKLVNRLAQQIVAIVERS